MRTLAIDPGATGGLAWIDRDGITQACAMPKGMTATVDMLRSLAAEFPDLRVSMEHVGTYVSGNSGPSAATFAGHCDGLRWAMYALGIPQDREPTPRTWQKAIGVPVEPPLPKGMEEKARRKELAARKLRRKHFVQEAMQRRHPHLRVTLNTADALGILAWAMGVRAQEGDIT